MMPSLALVKISRLKFESFIYLINNCFIIPVSANMYSLYRDKLLQMLGNMMANLMDIINCISKSMLFCNKANILKCVTLCHHCITVLPF